MITMRGAMVLLSRSIVCRSSLAVPEPRVQELPRLLPVPSVPAVEHVVHQRAVGGPECFIDHAQLGHRGPRRGFRKQDIVGTGLHQQWAWGDERGDVDVL